MSGWCDAAAYLCAAGGGDYSKMRHMFDGYGFLSRLRIEDGRAWGSQRYVQSKAYQAYKAQGKWMAGVSHDAQVHWLGYVIVNSFGWHCMSLLCGKCQKVSAVVATSSMQAAAPVPGSCMLAPWRAVNNGTSCSVSPCTPSESAASTCSNPLKAPSLDDHAFEAPSDG
jgi:hypothetical protein